MEEKNPDNQDNGEEPEEFDEPEEEVPELVVNESHPHLYQQVIHFLSGNAFCLECFGRQFSMLGTLTSNKARSEALLMGLTMEADNLLQKETLTNQFTLYGKAPLDILHLLSTQINFSPARQIYNRWIEKYPSETYSKLLDPKEGMCSLCQNILTPTSITQICDKVVMLSRSIEFANFLVGTYLNVQQVNFEEEFRVRFRIETGESFKANLNRLIGKELQQRWNKRPQFKRPDLMIMINLRDAPLTKVEFQAVPLFIKGRYRKFVRNLPQTHWNCFKCRGKGVLKFTQEICPDCNGTGDQYEFSIQDYVGSVVMKVAQGQKALFHGAGREDIDARCLGQGRPFVIEIKNPKKRSLDLTDLADQINQRYGAQIHISDLALTNKQHVIHLKTDSEFKQKTYHALVELTYPISRADFKEMLPEVETKLNHTTIKQRTPLRVVHRRADKTRTKEIFYCRLKYVDPVHLFVHIATQGGAYIKEIISGDDDRTNPSLSQIFNNPMKCINLDVIID